MWQTISSLAAILVPEEPFDFSKRKQCERFIAAIEDLDGALDHWEELPRDLAQCIKAQKGLRIDQRPIDSRKEAEIVYHLLHCKGSPKVLSIAGLVFSVLIAYAWTIRRQPTGKVADLMIIGAAPRDIISRACSTCHERALDDVFPYYSKRSPDHYVVKSSQHGCGRINCTGGRVLLRPLETSQRYVRALIDKLENIPNYRVRGGAPWERYFLRHGKDELETLPQSVWVKCPKENCQRTLESDLPRWTIHPVPTLVLRQFRCPDCHQKSDWKPVNKRIEFITSESLSRTYKRFKDRGCDLADYPRRADVCFSQSHIAIRIGQLKEIKSSLARSKQCN